MAAGPAAKTSGFAHNKQWNWRNFWICLAVGFIGEFAAAYSSCIIGVTLAQPAFLKYMGLVDENQKLTDNATPLIGATGGTFQAGAFFGVLITCWIMDKYGRKAATIFCATVSIIGGVCLCAAQSIGMFIAFRFVTGMGGISYTPVVVVYCVELAPPKLRGFFVGMNAMGITFGYAAASYMGLAFYYVEEAAAQWRGPLGLALVFSIAVLAVLPFVPESPRWLLMVGRVDEARDIIQTLHHIDGDPEQVYARAEFLQMKEQTELDRSLSPTWYQMFTRPSYRRRIVTACGLVFLGQSTAVLVINYYGPTIYKALGYDTLDQLIFQAGWLTLAIPSNFIGTCLMDRVGRKPLMLGSMIGCCAALVVETALIARFASPIGSTPNTAALRAGVAMLYVFQVFFGAGVEAAMVVYCTEIFPNHLRAKGIALVLSTISLVNIVYLQVAVTAFTTIGWRFFLLFIIITVLGIVWIAVYVPETKGMPLEELAAVFGARDEVAVLSEDIHVAASVADATDST